MKLSDDLAEAIATAVQRAYDHGVAVGSGQAAPDRAILAAEMLGLMVEIFSQSGVDERLPVEVARKIVGAVRGVGLRGLSRFDSRALAQVLRYCVLDGLVDAQEVYRLVEADLRARGLLSGDLDEWMRYLERPW